MSDPLVRLPQTTCEATPSVTSLPASVDGATPSDSLDGPTTDLFGRAVVPVSLSRPQAPKLAAPIPAIFGQRGIASSASAALQSSLVSRLRQRLPTAGSTLFAMTWKVMATPSGRSVCLLRASGHRISDNDSGSWPTPRVNDDNQSRMSEDASLREIARPNAGQSLALSAVLSAWPSPKAQNANGAGLHGRGGQDLQTLASWTTPQVHDRTKAGEAAQMRGGFHSSLSNSVLLASWATPTSRDHKDGSSIGTAPENALLGRQVWQTHGQTLPGSLAATAKPGQLNPAFSRWLMGYPPGWDACAATATPSSRKSLPPLSAPISTSKP